MWNTSGGKNTFNFKNGIRKGIEGFINCALAFLFFYCWNQESFVLHKMRPYNCIKYPAALISCHKNLRNTSRGTTWIISCNSLGFSVASQTLMYGRDMHLNKMDLSIMNTTWYMYIVFLQFLINLVA